MGSDTAMNAQTAPIPGRCLQAYAKHPNIHIIFDSCGFC